MTVAVVCGGRSIHPTQADAWALRAVLRWHGVSLLLHGACVHRCDVHDCKRVSLDVWAGKVAYRLGIAVVVSATDLGMVERAGQGGICIAFPGGRGTEGCVELAREHGLRVVRIA